MRVVVSVQPKAASSRGLVHYIAHSKIDASREPKTREIFNSYADAIAVEKASDILKSGASNKKPANDQLHHVVISLKAEDYDRLGTDEKEKQEALKKITRAALTKLEQSIGADRLNWAAGIHRNTDNPHVHIAIQKEFFDKNFERHSLRKIPNECLPHHEKTGDGSKTFAHGSIVEAATAKLDEIIAEKARTKDGAKQIRREQNEQSRVAEKTQKSEVGQTEKAVLSETKSNAEVENERGILARAVLAKFYLEKTRENLESLETSGYLRRFKITDALTGQKRRMSLSDLERRAEKSADRQIRKTNVTDAAKKDKLRRELVASEMEKNADGIKRIRAILHNLIVKENQNLRQRESDYDRIKPAAEKIWRAYARENKKLPIPNLSASELEMLQAGSIEKRDVRAANYYETVRKELARERGAPTRTPEEIRRLKALGILSELKVQFQEKQLKDLSDRKRFSPVEIGGEKWSLGKADSLIDKHEQDERKITGRIGKVLGRIGLVEPKNKRAKLEETKQAVAEKLSEKEEQMRAELQREKSILKTLDEFYKNESSAGKEHLAPEFTATELSEIESFAFELKNAELYRENWQHQKQFITRSDGGDSGNQKNIESFTESKRKTIAGRTLAREIMCETQISRAKEGLARFQKNKTFQKFEITDAKNGESKFVSLKEVEFNSRGSLLDQTLEYFTENREKRRTRHQLEKMVKEKESELKENLKSARELLKVAGAETGDFKQKSFFGAVNYTEMPIFTPKELMTLEIRIRETENKSEAAKLQKILGAVNYEQVKNLSVILANVAGEDKFSKNANGQRIKEQDETKSVHDTGANTRTRLNEISEAKTQGGREITREDKEANIQQERGR
jgi:hypothetical protein